LIHNTGYFLPGGNPLSEPNCWIWQNRYQIKNGHEWKIPHQ